MATYYELSVVEDYTDFLQFENCSHVGVPYVLLKLGRRVLLHVTIDVQANARLIIPYQCKKANIVQGQCVATGNVTEKPTSTFFALVNYGDGSIFFSCQENSRITFTATWGTD